MNYLVLVRYLWKGETAWKTIQREFNDESTAEQYAKEMYDSAAKGEEITVLIYKLEKSYN